MLGAQGKIFLELQQKYFQSVTSNIFPLLLSRNWGGYWGDGDAGRQRAEPDAVGQADGDRGGGGLHQDPDRRGDQAALGPETALVSILGHNITFTLEKI